MERRKVPAVKPAWSTVHGIFGFAEKRAQLSPTFISDQFGSWYLESA